MSGRKNKVVSPQEEHLVQKAEALKAAGFEQPAQFDLQKDMSEMNAFLGGTSPSTVTKTSQTGTADHDFAIPPQESPSVVDPVEKDIPPKEEDTGWSEDPEQRIQQLASILAKMTSNAPTAEQIKQWKTVHRDVFYLHIEGFHFLYRYIKRQEWVQMHADQRFANATEQQIDEYLFNQCLLWPSIDPLALAGMPAGAVPMIASQIKLQSFFLEPANVVQMTVKI